MVNKILKVILFWTKVRYVLFIKTRPEGRGYKENIKLTNLFPVETGI